VLILPGTEMPTAAVYRRFDELGLGGEDRFGRDGEVADEPNWREWAALGAVPLLRRLVNDLEPAAFSLDPALGRLRSNVESQLGRPVRMSGSGSSLFTLFDARDEAEAAAASVGRVQGVRGSAVEVAPPTGDLALP
jgi:4-diphosphocytidyl-2C-methyl-D-erythritol kinase